MTRKTWALLIWFGFVSIACNLTSSDKPPTLMPQGPIAASTQATLGYVAPPPGAVAEGTAVAARPPVDVELYNLLNQVDTDRLMVHIDTLVGFHTRHVNSSTTSQTKGVGAAAMYLYDQFQLIQARSPQNFTVHYHEFTAHYNGLATTQRNVFAVLTGTDVGGGVIVVGAHYDSRGDDLTDAESAAPGADDNGSGVAAVLELARLLSQRPHRSTIIFVLFSAEEVSRQGSKAFVKDYLNRFDDNPVFAMLNLDTIGSWNAPDGTINSKEIRVFSERPNDSQGRQLARTIEFIATHHGLNLKVSVQDQIDREGRYGDHESFSEAGYPSVRLIEAVEDHPKRDSRDTIDGVEPAYLADATRTVLGIVTALADGLRPPRNISLRDLGNGTQTLVWESVPGASRYIVAVRRPDSLIFAQHFITLEATSGAWGNWSQYEAVAIAAEDANGLVGPFSVEYKIPR